jgi:hypothetical protein
MFLDELASGKRKRVMDKATFDDERKLGGEYGIFSLAVGWNTGDKAMRRPGDESFEAFIDAVAPGTLDQAKAEAGDSKVRRGRWLGTNTPWPRQVGDLYVHLITALEQRGLSS